MRGFDRWFQTSLSVLARWCLLTGMDNVLCPCVSVEHGLLQSRCPGLKAQGVGITGSVHSSSLCADTGTLPPLLSDRVLMLVIMVVT